MGKAEAAETGGDERGAKVYKAGACCDRQIRARWSACLPPPTRQPTKNTQPPTHNPA